MPQRWHGIGFRLLAPVVGIIFGLQLANSQPQKASATPFDRDAMLAHLAYHVMLPSYLDFEAAAKALQSDTDQLCQAPALDRLEAAQASWTQAALTWNRSEAFQLNLTQTYAKSIGFWPTRERRIQSALGDDKPMTAAYIESMGAAAHGLSAMEYLLFDTDARQTAVLQAMQEGALAKRWCPYLVATAAHLVDKAQAVARLWRSEGQDFSGKVARAGQGGTLYPTSHRAISDIVNRLVSTVETVANGKIDKPLRGNGLQPWPNAVQAGRSGTSKALLIATLEGALAVYSGEGGTQPGPGFDDFLTALGSDLGSRITGQFQAALTAARAIPDPLRIAIVEQPQTVQATYEAVHQLLILLKVDMTNVLSVTVDFSDNDGD
jgi:predicted lipoprotein